MNAANKELGELADWLKRLEPTGYDLVYYPKPGAVDLFGAVRRWPHVGLADVLLLCAEDDAALYRIRCGDGGNPFAPGIVMGQMIGNALDAVRLAVRLPRPGNASCHDTPEAMHPLIAELAAPLVKGFYTTRYSRNRPAALNLSQSTATS